VQFLAPTAPCGGEINQTRFVTDIFPLRLLTRAEVIEANFLLKVFCGEIRQTLSHGGKGNKYHQNGKNESFLHNFFILGCKITKKIVTLQTFYYKKSNATSFYSTLRVSFHCPTRTGVCANGYSYQGAMFATFRRIHRGNIVSSAGVGGR
jgi:hypothetical protein